MAERTVRRATRRVAERARGLALISASPARTGLATASKVGAGPVPVGCRTGGASRDGSVAAALLEEALHDPVLEAVEGDDGEPAAGLQHLLGRLEPAFELLQAPR